MYLIYDQALVTQSSGSIKFFKIDKETGLWTQYHQLDKMRGQLFFMKGNKRIQITTDDKIYFYLISNETLMPELENVMFNFMGASQMMFGSKVRFCVTFKTNQPNFSIYCRKYYHNFKVAISNENLEGAVGANIAKSQQYIIADDREVTIYDMETY